MEKKLHGKLALVTGSSRGVGQQIIKGLAQLGANVLIHGRKKESTSKTLEMVNEFPVETHVIEGDLSDNSQIKKMVEYIIDHFGGIDILYNNAGISSPFRKNIWEHESEVWSNLFQVNVFAMYYLCSAFIPGMIKRGYGRVINLTSGIKDQPELLPYSVSKAAVDKLTEDIAIKLGGTGVRINRLDPGWLKTDMGGPEAWYPVDHVLPGALVPSLIADDGPNGEFFSAIELRNTTL